MAAPSSPDVSAASAGTSGDVTEMPDAFSARGAAARLGHRVEIVDSRTPGTSTYANADGTLTLESSTYDRNIAGTDGTLHPVDDTLGQAADGTWSPALNALRPRFAATVGPAAATVRTPGGDIRFGPVSSSPSAARKAATDKLVFPNALPAVDLTYQVLPSAVKETLVLANASAGHAWTFAYDAPGMVASAAPDGSIVFNDAKTGVVRGVIPQGAAWDSAATSAATPVRLQLVGTAPNIRVQVSVDQTWLASPARVWPIYVDPSMTAAQGADTAYKSDGTTCTNPTCGIRGGNSQSGVGGTDTFWRSTVHFGYESLFGKHILGATINETVNAGTNNCYNHIWYLVNSEAYGGYGTAQTASSNLCATGSVSSATLNATLQSWATNSTSNKRLFVRGQESLGLYTYKQFAATIAVTFNSYPSEPRGRTVTPCFSCSVSPVSTASLTPTLGAQSTDTDGNSLRYQYQVFTGSAPAGNATPIADSGLLSPAIAQNTHKSWAVPAGKLSNGGTYSYKVRAYDGTDYGNWSNTTGGWVTFIVDTTKPLTPTATSVTYPENGWANASSGTFTLGNGGSSDVVGYYTHLDSAAQTYQTGTSLTLSAVATGPHHLYVQSIDGAGNLSPVRDYAFNAGIGAITSPHEGDRTQKRVTLTVAAQAGFTTVRFQYRRGDADAFTDIPLAALTKASDGSALTSQDIAITAGTSMPVTWDVTASPLVGTLDGPVQVQAVLSPGTSQNTAPVHLTLDQTGAGIASSSVGPGTVNLLTGDLTLAGSDVSIGAYSNDLTLSRSFSSRNPGATPTGPFGPGWVASVSVDDANSDYTGLTVNGSLVSIGTSDGSSIGFTRNADNISYRPEIGLEDLTLTSDSGQTTFTLKDLDGNATTFTNPTGAGFLPTAISVPGSAQTTSTSWETISGVTRPTRMLAPSPAGITCNATVANTGTLPAGCRAIVLKYAASSTTPPVAGSYGDYPNRLSSVSFYGGTNGASPNPTVAAPVTVASFAYDSAGRLAQTWDPRISPALKTQYGYDSGNRVSTVTPPGLTPWTMDYVTSGTDAGRLLDVRRVDPDATLGTAVTTMLYGVPVSGAGAPYDLSTTTRGTWGETAVPTDATAIVPPLSDNTPATTADLNKAVVHYLDSSGREVNTAAPGGRISTSEYDSWGNTIRALSPANRQRALDSSTDPVVQAATSRLLDEQSIYSSDGTLLLETYGPQHQASVAGTVQPARAHTVNTYDEGAPGTGGPYRLLTTSKTGARVAGATTDSDVRTSTTSYDWTLRQPTASTTDPTGLALKTSTTYDSVTGLVTSTTLPGSAVTTTAQTTTTTYYTAAANGTYSSCGNRPEWAGLVCRTGPAGQPTTGTGRPAIPATYTTYDIYNSPVDVIDKNDSTGAVLRTSHNDYDTAGRSIGSSVTATTSPTSVPVPATTTSYWPLTGLPYQVSFTDAGVTRNITSTYDALGRKTSYQDADGATAQTTKFDLQGRTVSTTDGKGTQTRSYDPVTGDLTGLVDSDAGTWIVSYTTAGDLKTVTAPGGLTEDVVSDETGSQTDLTWTLPAACVSECVLSDHADENVFGQQIQHDGNLSSQTYRYDAAGRLTGVQDQDDPSNTCTSRAYFFDPAAANGAGKDSNRTGYASSSAAGTVCPAIPTAPSVSYSYDTADRSTDAGYSYDELGRIIAVPAAATLDGTGQAPTYYANDIAATLGGSTFTLDPSSSRLRAVTTPAGTSIRHYDDDGDSPSWSTNPANGAEYQRNITGPAGDLAAVRGYDGTVSLQLTNLHGDVIATTTAGLGNTTSTFDSTEFGAPRTSTDVGTRRYGWLGAKTREADNASGIIRMGVRLYNPMSGRFLQTDPVAGGSANNYDYANQDPINNFDLDGKCFWGAPRWYCKYRGAVKRAGHWVDRHAIGQAGGCIVSFCAQASYNHRTFQVSFGTGMGRYDLLARGFRSMTSFGLSAGYVSRSIDHQGNGGSLEGCVMVRYGGCVSGGRVSGSKNKYWWGVTGGAGRGWSAGLYKTVWSHHYGGE